MKKWFDKLNIYHKCSVLSAIFLFLAIVILIPCHFFNFLEYPLGYILGISYGIIIFFINGLIENHNKTGYKWAIVFVVLRYFIFALLLILVGLCYYMWEIKFFNLFLVTGGYMTSIVISLVLYLLENKAER